MWWHSEIVDITLPPHEKSLSEHKIVKDRCLRQRPIIIFKKDRCLRQRPFYIFKRWAAVRQPSLNFNGIGN